MKTAYVGSLIVFQVVFAAALAWPQSYGSVERLSPAVNQIVPVNARIERVATVFSHVNQVESATAFTNYSGGLENERLYYPWGHYWTQLGPTMEEVYGGITDDQELYAALQRRQNPGLGRWLTPDPAGLAAIDLMNPQSWNAYAYALNNPTTRTDPSGLYVCNGSKEECQTIHDALNTVQQAESKLKAGSQEQQKLVYGFSKTYPLKSFP